MIFKVVFSGADPLKDVNVMDAWGYTTLCERKEISGERGRNRTYNLLIKSQLLCQLSYAPSKTYGLF